MAAVPNSILDTTKKALGVDADNTEFDIDILMHINSVFSTLQQLAVGPPDGFMIEDSSKLWSDFLGDKALLINSVKTLMYLQVRMWFDPPTTSFDLTAKKEQILEIQWRLNVAVDKSWTPPVDPTNPDGGGDSIILPDDFEQQIEDLVEDEVEEYLLTHPLADGLTHTQSSPSASWSFDHALGRIPVVSVYINGELVLADVQATTSHVTIQFPTPTSGVAVLT